MRIRIDINRRRNCTCTSQAHTVRKYIYIPVYICYIQTDYQYNTKHINRTHITGFAQSVYY